ncbi:uncharacterized protein GGS22DRAFT_199148 [Annulohypoxylon maeteangense]|uniref:uncharacterized protein n=1 Tax=Annulohypoxylon maeteangense TaxID=1927788 RepID=UPI0020075DF4|nr:uncharacterized protein GGS22DRAFT_199148 [Annulohypoxylon maeteangense]KAI0886791.1 hypothetical protein GGS22DRAFT_199148 [Annulohypoxylon maeteangense]
MAWHETQQKGVFSRPIGENEAYIKLVGDSGLPLNREHWAINATATIIPTGTFASTDAASRFPTAWAHLRFQHPSLAAEVSPDGANLTYIVPATTAALETWVSQTFSVASTAHSSTDVIPTFKPTPHAKLVYIPQSHELLLHSTHWRTDGLGVLLLLDALLALASTPNPPTSSLPWGTEPARLTPSIEVAASIPLTPTAEQKARAAELVSTFAHVAGGVGLPCLGSAGTGPGGTRSAAVVFSAEATEGVVRACKVRGVSVTAAVHASVAGANYELADPDGYGGKGEEEKRHYASTIRFGLRPFLAEPFSGGGGAAGLYTTGWMKRVEARDGWGGWVREFGEEYRGGVTRGFLDAHREYAVQLGELLRGLGGKEGAGEEGEGGVRMPSDVDISSIGVAEKLVKRFYGSEEAGFEVRAVGVGVEILSRQGVTFVWTFRDQLNLSVVYNEAFHSAEQMNLFVNTVKSQLLKGLSLQDD